MKKHWGIIRTIMFLIIGIKFTFIIDPKLTGMWENYLGYALLAIGLLDGFLLIKKYLSVKT